MATAKVRWVWAESTKELVLEGDTAAKARYRRRQKASMLDTQSIRDHSPDRIVTLEDVKGVAVDHMDATLLSKMPDDVVAVFDCCCRTDTFNEFLWAILVYYKCFVKQREAAEDEAADIPGSLGESARAARAETTSLLQDAEATLGFSYIKVISGIGMGFAHHTSQGRMKFSKTHTDNKLFEAVYEFVMCVTWVTFGYNDWQTIHSELGRILRTPEFNKDMKDRREETNDESSEPCSMTTLADDSALTEKIYHHRPPRGHLKHIKSPVLDTLLQRLKSIGISIPTSADSKTLVSERNIGIIGQPMLRYHPLTLKPLITEQL